MSAGFGEGTAIDLIRSFEPLRSQRETDFDSVWEEIARRVLPRYEFRGDRRRYATSQEDIFDATAATGLKRFGAAMESMLTPRSQLWHALAASDPKLENNDRVARYLEAVRDILFAARRSPAANFASQLHEAYLSLGAFGTGAVLVMPGEDGRSPVYRSIPLQELYVAENAAGRIDKVYRRYWQTARQMAQHFGEDALPDPIAKCLADKPEERFELLHIVRPNRDIDPGRRDWRSMTFESWHLTVQHPHVLRRSGFRTMPYAVSRYVTAPGEVYGRSPALEVLPDIKMADRMSRTIIDRANLAAEPPQLAVDDDLPVPVLIPNAVNPGWLNRDGSPKIRPLEPGSDFAVGLEMLDQRHRSINDAFLVTLFQILVDSPSMTATEAMLRSQEKGALLAPTMGRQQSELLAPIIEREIDILTAAEMLPDMPPELVEAGGAIEVEYLSPLARAQRMEQATGLVRTLEAIMPLAQHDPSILDNIDADKALRGLAEINGVDMDMMRPVEEVLERRRQQQEAMQMQQAAAMAPGLKAGAEAAATLSQMEGAA